MTVTSFVAVVAPRKCKIIKRFLNVFEGGEHFLQNLYYTLYSKKPIVRNCDTKLELIQASNIKKGDSNNSN